jgi:hypothetical protein
MKKMSDTFTIERPEYLSDSAWEALCEGVERYVEEWEEWEDEEDEDDE